MNNFYERAYKTFTSNGYLPSKAYEGFTEETMTPFMRSHRGSWYIVILINMDKLSMQEFKIANLTYASFYKNQTERRNNISLLNVLVTSEPNPFVSSFIENLKEFEPSDFNNIFWHICLEDAEIMQNKTHPTEILDVKNLLNQALGKAEETVLTEINDLKTPHLTLGLIALNIVSFIFVSVSGGPTAQNLVRLGAIHPQYILEGGEFYRLFSAIFLHGSIMHLFMNMYILYLLGKKLENLIGAFKYGILYLVSGLFGSLFSLFLSNTISVGASGAIFGVASGLLFIFYKNRTEVGGMGSGDLISFIAINTVIGFTIPLIDFWGHTGGLIGGFLCAFIFLNFGNKVKNEN